MASAAGMLVTDGVSEEHVALTLRTCAEEGKSYSPSQPVLDSVHIADFSICEKKGKSLDTVEEIIIILIMVTIMIITTINAYI